MNRIAEGERARKIYRGYGEDPGKQRGWAADNPGNLAIRDELTRSVLSLADVSRLSSGRLLDVGCGTGWWLQTLAARQDIEVPLYGIDILRERVESASRRVPSGTLVVGDARALPYESGRFSVVTMLTVLSSLAGEADAAQAMREGWRVLGPGGVLIIWEPRIANPRNRFTILITPRLVHRALGGEVQRRTLTVLPGLARRLGSRTGQLYPILASIPMLRTHQLMWMRKDGRS